MRKTLHTIRDTLNLPYPITEDINDIVRDSFFIALVVFMILLVFQPFGLSRIPADRRLFTLLGYGAITFMILFLNQTLLPKFFPKIFQEQRWNVKREILVTLWLIFIIGLGNSIYTSVLGYVEFDWSSIISFQLYTLFVGFFPIVLFITIRINVMLRQNLNAAMLLNSGIQDGKQTRHSDAGISPALVLTSENSKETMTVALMNLYFLKSAGNYVEIFHSDKEKFTKSLLRSSLTRIERMTKSVPSLVRCHRTLIVNIDKIDNVIGNSQGCTLEFHAPHWEIPVARKYIKPLRSLMCHSSLNQTIHPTSTTIRP